MEIIDLSSRKKIKSSKHWVANIDQLYHPTGVFPQDHFDIVYNYEDINRTKFSPILLKEWFYLVKENGYLIIDYSPNSLLDWQGLEERMWWLWKGKYEIIFHGQVKKTETSNQTEKSIVNYIVTKEKNKQSLSVTERDSKYNRFICKKICSTAIKGDSINKWTFGIVTNGKRLDWMDEIIKSIRDQKIPSYEIVICGTYPKKVEKDIKYIPFNQRDDLGWITKKKNIIAQEAKYENLCIVHDRLVFEKNWFKGMKKWGNTFDHLACGQKFQGVRINDWEIHENLPGLEFSFVSLLDYRDWDILGCQGGQLHILKKSLAVDVKWNETYYWGRAEDLKISNDLRDKGSILRFNPNSGFKVLAYRFGQIPTIPLDSLKLSDKREGDFKRITGRRVYQKIYQHRILKDIMIWMFKKIQH